MTAVNKTSKRKRRDPHAGRARGSQLQTGHSAGPKTRLTEPQKVLLGGGMLDTIEEIWPATPWRGAGLVRYPANPAQAAENKRLYPWIFENGRRS